MDQYTRSPAHAGTPLEEDDMELSLVNKEPIPRQDHACVLRKESKWWRWLRAWYLPPIHTVFSFAFWYGMRFQLQGIIFAIGRGDNVPAAAPGRWYQSDLTTTVAICLMISRVIAGMLQTLTTWRCIFFLFEQESLSLNDFEFVSSYMLPNIGLMKALRKTSTLWLTLSAILLAWPAQFVSPIATGSLTWLPNYVYDQSSQLTLKDFTDRATDDYHWSWFEFWNVRLRLVDSSAGLANVQSYLLANGSENMIVPPARRPSFAFRELSNGTSIQNVTVPYIGISSFTWLANPSATLDAAEQDAILENYSGHLNISGWTSPLLYTNLEGTAAPLKTTSYNAYNKTWPSPYVFRGTKDVALLVAGFDNDNTPSIPCTFAKSFNFEPTPGPGFVPYYSDNDRTYCYAVARMELVAGIVDCSSSEDAKQCRLSASSPLAVVSHGAISSEDIMPDPLVDIVFATMPEVMALMIPTGGFGSYFTKKVDPEAFLRAAVTTAYQGTWSALTEGFLGPPTDLRYIEPTPVVLSAVSDWRMDVWLGIQLLLTFACVLVAVLQSISCRPVVLNPILKLLLLDNSHILAQDRDGLCMASSLDDKDEKLDRLMFDQNLGRRHHDVLRFVKGEKH